MGSMEGHIQTVQFEAPASSRVCYAVSIMQTINEDGEYVLDTSYLGDPSRAAVIGILQSVLDHERDLMRRSWGPTK